MKNRIIKKIIGMTMMTLFFAACNDILEEQPRSIYEPSYFQTEAGVNGGLTGMYAHLRYIYGSVGYFNASQTGTDEATWGASGSGSGFQIHDLTGLGAIAANNGAAGVLWDRAFPNINTASGIIENATEVGTISDALIAEARFFRAFDYFMLVQTFGGVPLDLGAGELAFNTSTSRFSVRNTVPEVYTLAIFPDLLTAIEDLDDSPREIGAVTKTVARLFLAKAYLTYGWWLDNPNGIPTYPETSRTDLDGHDSQWYYQEAYNVALAGIDNAGSTYGLQEFYYDVNVGSNDRNSECMLYADHTNSNEFYNGSSFGYSGASEADNAAIWMQTWNYTAIISSKIGWNNSDDEPVTLNSVQREAAQSYGRPWVRMAPPHGVFSSTFADKTNDSRYDGTFATTFRGNWDKAGNEEEFLYNANDSQVVPNDAILTFLDEEPATAIDYSNDPYNSGVGAGVLPGRADYVVGPTAISRLVFPNLWKLGTYRTDNEGTLGQPNGAITRPFNIAKFSELYFVAAEAAVQGATPLGGRDARSLINVIRARAGKWRWDNNGNAEKLEDNSVAMVAATPAAIDIDYILEERSREYYGECYRWYDLVRTQKWNQIASTYVICGPGKDDKTPETFNRTIQPHHYLRPIPQGQLDGMEMTEQEKAAYQNPGYE